MADDVKKKQNNSRRQRTKTYGGGKKRRQRTTNYGGGTKQPIRTKFDWDEYFRMTYWCRRAPPGKNIQMAIKNRKRVIKSRQRVLEQYLATQRGTSEQRQWAKDLHDHILRQHAAHRTAREQGIAKPTITGMWALVWGRRSSTEVANDNKVRRGLVKWAAESDEWNVYCQNHFKDEWNEVLPGRKVNRTTSKPQATAPLSSTPNTYMALSSANLDDSSVGEITPETNNNCDSEVQ